VSCCLCTGVMTSPPSLLLIVAQPYLHRPVRLPPSARSGHEQRGTRREEPADTGSHAEASTRRRTAPHATPLA
jgi:hypothetical protein